MPKSKNNQKGQQPNKSKNKKSLANLERKLVSLAINGRARPNSSVIRGRGAYNVSADTRLGAIGQLAGDGVSKFFGLGAYQIRQNSLFDASTQSQVPIMHSNSESVVFRHREYIADVITNPAFSQNSYPINPGVVGTFPYLAGLATQFQEYEFRGLIFEFKSTCGDAVASTNSALGSVTMTVQYRADLPPPNSKQAMLNEMWSVDVKPSMNVVLPVECSPRENPYAVQYVRGSTFTGDQKMYDLGTLVVATSGSQAAFTAGELWASYEVVLRKPIPGSLLGIDNFDFEALASTSNSSNPLGTSWSFQPAGIVNPSWFSLSNTAITFYVPGTYLVAIYWTGGASAAVAPPGVSVSSTATLSGSLSAPNNGVTSTALSVLYIFNTGSLISPSAGLPASAAISFAAGATFPGTPTTRIYVAQISSGGYV